MLSCVAAALFLAGAACLTVALVWEPKTVSNGHDIHEFFVAVWPVCFTLVFAVVLYEFWLRKWFVTELVSVSGPMVIQALRPRETLRTLLDLVYGEKGQNRDVVTGVLGGFGESADHHDLSISQSTSVLLTLADTDADPASYELTIKANYGFVNQTPADEPYVFFVTTDPTIRDLLAIACDRPLFDYWYFPGTPDLEPELAKLRRSFAVRLDYKDADGVQYTTDPFTPTLHEVTWDKWPSYLRIFRENLGTQRKLDPERYKDTLAILTFDFAEPLDDEKIVWDSLSAIEIKSATIQAKSDAYCYWAATYPCLVTEIAFDVSRLTGVNGEALEFRKVPFLLRANITHDEWSPRPRRLRPGTWLLAGHGVALIWRAAEQQGSQVEQEQEQEDTSATTGADRPTSGVVDDSVRKVAIAESVAISLDEMWRRVVSRVAVGDFGSSAEITSRRRDVDRLTALLAAADDAVPAESPRLDEPWWRIAVAAARRGVGPEMLRDANRMTVEASAASHSPERDLKPPRPWDGDSDRTPESLRRGFAEVIKRAFANTDGTGWSGGIVEAGDADLASRLQNATESGWRLLSGEAPELLNTLAGHVSRIAWTSLHSSDTTFRSGTQPDLPGVVLLSADVAESQRYFVEAFVHEAAHCKFFDLCLARNIVGMLGTGDDRWQIEVPWVDETSRRPRRWPLDQALAAAHAYLHVALLAGSLAATARDSTDASHWSGRCAESTERATLLLSAMGDPPAGAVGAEGLGFVDWMQGLVQLVRNAATHVAQGWSGTGPLVCLSAEVKTLRAATSEYSLIGVVGTGAAMMLPVDVAEFVEAGAPTTIGGVAMTKLAAGATPPAEALVEALDIVGALDAMGVVDLTQVQCEPRETRS